MPVPNLQEVEMIEHDIGGVRFFSYSLFESFPNVTNVVSTRNGGLSAEPYDTLNLGFHVGDAVDTVLDNRARLAQALGLEPETFTLPAQVHGAEIAVVTGDERGHGAVSEDDAVAAADAIITRTPDVPILVLVADCVPVSFYDPGTAAVAIVHAGWKGTVKRVAERTVQRMVEEFGSDPSEIVAGIGPSIGRGHYEVGDEVFDAFKAEFGAGEARKVVQEDMDGTCYLDLWRANAMQLEAAGLAHANVQTADLCTACLPDVFYSHRHDGGKTGRFAALIVLNSRTSRPY